MEQQANDTAIEEFWHAARGHLGWGDTSWITGTLWADAVVPPAWAFGDNPALADQLLALVLDGTKTGTASVLWEYEDSDEPMPKKNDVSIILDGEGRPRAAIRTTSVEVVPFYEVTAEHAYAEGEDDRTLESWRREHEKYWRRVFEGTDRQFAEDMPVVCERFTLFYPSSSH